MISGAPISTGAGECVSWRAALGFCPPLPPGERRGYAGSVAASRRNTKLLMYGERPLS